MLSAPEAYCSGELKQDECSCVEVVDINNGDPTSPIITIELFDSTLKLESGDFLRNRSAPPGEFAHSKEVVSSKGCPIVEFICHCESPEDNFTAEIIAERGGDSVHIGLKPEGAPVVWLKTTALQSKAPQTRKRPEMLSPIRLEKDGNAYWFTTISDTSYKVALDGVLENGRWTIDTSVFRAKSDMTLKWSCTFNLDRGHLCYCDSTLDEDALRDNPTCWNLTREVYFAVDFSAGFEKLTLTVIKTNVSEVGPARKGRTFTVPVLERLF